MMKKIDSIEKLRERKEILKLKMKYTRVALGDSVGELREETVGAVQAKINEKLMPLDLISDGLKLVCQITGNIDGSTDREMVYSQAKQEPWYKPLIPVAVELVSNIALQYLQEQNGSSSVVMHSNGVERKKMAVAD